MYPPRRILIADDDPDIRTGASDLLAGTGLVVLQAEDGTQAMELLNTDTPVHLALLDLQMPGFGGLELFQHMLDHDLRVPTILWSGDAGVGVERFALDRGASAFLHKPVPPKILRQQVLAVLESHWGPLHP
ncbi:MAG: response regulator [Planctomycetes bacterium]|nr:response regulator [Planctomycetota bacterium]MCB9910933.1 response regulator [Planctomycetota bacterium]MCB9911600.1 response regulator [Planctomycetota bacterium]HPF13073.1 response regulator [Planctomycetota bacterium]HRV81604.1 response regulator [Planctomycetota bacterium]